MFEGMLVDYEYCTGCHSCEIACAVSHNLPNDRAGVVLHHEGAWEISEDVWQDTYLPVFTDVCDKCLGGVAAHDGAPMCVHHCQAHVLKIGSIESLARELARKPKQVLYAL